VPSSDLYIEKDSSINDEIERLRLRATAALLEREDVIIVSSVSCIYGLGSPDDYTHSLIFIKPGDRIERDEFCRNLLRIQYDRNDIDFSRGKFRVRGDVVEVFPAYHTEGVRFEFFGDEIESVKRIDPVTGSALEVMERVAIYPAKHFITSPPKIKEAIEDIEAELRERIKFFNDEGKPLEAERIESRTRYDVEMLQQVGYCNGIENYSRHLTRRKEGERPACLIDYFPSDFMLLVDEAHVTIPQVGGMFAGDRSRKENLVNFGFRLPSALDNRPLNFGEFESLTKNVLFVSATPGPYERGITKNVVEQLIRPTGLLDPLIEVRPKKDQIQDLYNEIQGTIKKGYRTFITTLTKKMAEDLTDYYQDMNLKVRYLHSEIETFERVELLKNLRAGEFDVLIGINLMREGLDCPEVALVAILDADQEGFLRSETSLIQTSGRAARNVDGKVIFYADKITKSMQRTIDETERRRAVQMEHNEKHGITPKSIKKEIKDILVRVSETDEERNTERIIKDIKKDINFDLKNKKMLIDTIKEAMLEAARDLDFEKAAILRDKMLELEGKRKK